MLAKLTSSAAWAWLLLMLLFCWTSMVSLDTEKDRIESDLSWPADETFRRWAHDFGGDILLWFEQITTFRELSKQFMDAGAIVKQEAGVDILTAMGDQMVRMLNDKNMAVKRLVEVVEEAYMEYTDKTVEELEEEVPNFFYAKLINEFDENNDLINGSNYLELKPHEHFNMIPVNFTYSTIHVPTNVYHKAPDVMNAIIWSKKLDEIFKSNFDNDPTLTWQYFGSNTGMFRNYPGMKWMVDPKTRLDLFDCRTRGWYIQGATSPKDLVILVDASGSMTGLRMEIAKQTVESILATLSDDDYFNILKFSEEVEYIEPCFNGTLVQANLDNRKLLREAIDNISTKFIADYEKALTEVFQLLHKVSSAGQATLCNQAIMLITDGAPDNYKHIFDKYNTEKNVRLFTYLIGRDASEYKEVKWMACANKGYFSHVATLADVQEHVEYYIDGSIYKIMNMWKQNQPETPKNPDENTMYINVLSRPMVLNDAHTTVWTGVYHDKAEPKTMHWISFIKNKSDTRSDDIDEFDELKGLRMMTSVAQPVFDRKEETTHEGNLLGVMGTDVPLKELTKLTPPFRLGPNGYSFAITNNGYVLFHPDLRPMFQGKTKPNYNSIDLAEVEIPNIDNLDGPDYNMPLRTAMIKQDEALVKEDRQIAMEVRAHYDNMKRVVVKENRYFYKFLGNTPFSLAIALPMPYGIYHVRGNIHPRDVSDKMYAQMFLGLNNKTWRVASDWVYCRYIHDDVPHGKEEALLYYINIGRNHSTISQALYKEKCEKALGLLPEDPVSPISNFLFDANVTKDLTRVWAKATEGTFKDYGVELVWIGTRSGLTRFYEAAENLTDPNFINRIRGTVTEVYYKRAVEIGRNQVVLSVDFDVGEKTAEINDTVVSLYSPVVVAPSADKPDYHPSTAAVVGMQMKHSFIRNYFFDRVRVIMNESAHISELSCDDDELECFVLDDSGFVVISEVYEEVITGKFFGDIQPRLMEVMVDSGIYTRVRMFEFQGMCQEQFQETASSCRPDNLFSTLFSVISWLWKELLVLLIQYNIFTLWNGGHFYTAQASQFISDWDGYEPCHQEMDLFYLSKEFVDMRRDRIYDNCANCKSKVYSVVRIPNTNLILMAHDTRCYCNPKDRLSIEPQQMEYYDDMCFFRRKEIFRKRPAACFPSHANETDNCGMASHTLQASHILLFFSLLLNLFPYSAFSLLWRWQQEPR